MRKQAGAVKGVQLPDVFYHDPAHASALMSEKEFHALTKATGGTVYIRRKTWGLIPERRRGFVRVTLRVVS